MNSRSRSDGACSVSRRGTGGGGGGGSSSNSVHSNIYAVVNQFHGEIYSVFFIVSLSMVVVMGCHSRCRLAV